MRPVARIVRVGWAITTALLLGVFAVYFDPTINSWPANAAWAFAVTVWFLGAFLNDRSQRESRARWRPDWLLLVALAVLSIVWLPFYDNWRFCVGGDSGPWFELALTSAEQGLHCSLLSIRGIWNHFTYTQVIVDNGLMFLVEPTFFWHRVSKLVISLVGLVAIYSYWSLLLSRPWALAAVLVTATNFMWIIFSYISYQHIDSFIYAYFTLAAITLTFRQPERTIWWVAAGTVAGLSLFFTQTAWAEILVGGVGLGVWALYRRHFRGLLLCGSSFVIAGFPVILQLGDLIALNYTLHARQDLDWGYLWGFFRLIFWLPYGSDLDSIGVQDFFFFAPWGQLYLAGVVVAALCVIPGIRRFFGLPLATTGVLCLLLCDVALLALTNFGFPLASAKRTYHLVPLQAFFCLLPLYVLASIGGKRSAAVRRTVTAATFAAIAIYAAANLTFFELPGRFGSMMRDGLVELRQRYPDKKVLILDRRPELATMVNDPSSLLNRMYRVGDTISVTASLDESMVARICSAGGFVCRTNSDESTRALFRDLTTAHRSPLDHIDRVAVPEIDCIRCQ